MPSPLSRSHTCAGVQAQQKLQPKAFYGVVTTPAAPLGSPLPPTTGFQDLGAPGQARPIMLPLGHHLYPLYP